MDSLQVFSATCRRFAFLMSASVLVPLMCRTWIKSYRVGDGHQHCMSCTFTVCYQINEGAVTPNTAFPQWQIYMLRISLFLKIYEHHLKHLKCKFKWSLNLDLVRCNPNRDCVNAICSTLRHLFGWIYHDKIIKILWFLKTRLNVIDKKKSHQICNSADPFRHCTNGEGDTSLSS